MESVSSIHKRWSLTRLNPSSVKTSFVISILATSFLIFIVESRIYNSSNNLFYTLLVGLPIAVGLGFFDFWSLRNTPLNKLSKVFHVSAFSYLLWVGSVILGLLSQTALGRESSPILYVVEGMFLSIGLRIAIFRSVFGANLVRSVVVGVVQPSLMAIIIIGYPASNTYTRHELDFVPLFGILFIGLSILWTELADRAGRPYVVSTFSLLQAFLNAWTNSNPKEMEKFTESRSELQTVRTLIAKFKKEKEVPFHIILPDIHPGPFNPVGGSNLPYVLFSTFSKKAIILHSVSNHSLNLPSITELNSYIASLDKQDYIAKHQMCSIPCQVQVSSFTATGLKFGDTVMLLLSRAPEGMDDLSDGVLQQLETYSRLLGFNNILVIDCHNALGSQLSQTNYESLLDAGRKCLEELSRSQEFSFRIGFANLCDISYDMDSLKDDLGGSGLATMAIEVNAHYYVIGWADSNNMDNTLREQLVSFMSERGIQLLEVCTSDTHATSGKRTRQGYFAFGSITRPKIAAEIFYLLARKSIESLTPSIFELASIKTKVRVMGKKQFDEYAVALNKSLFLTKIFVLTTVSIFIATLIL